MQFRRGLTTKLGEPPIVGSQEESQEDYPTGDSERREWRDKKTIWCPKSCISKRVEDPVVSMPWRDQV